MFYEFPRIQHISDVLPHLKNADGSTDFVVAEKDGYTVVNYIMMTGETFPKEHTEASKIRRECRGIIFCSATGKILSRPFHKFFNLNEREETMHENIVWNLPYLTVEKLDGSMIRPIPLQDGKVIRWGTKMGVTTVAMDAEVFVATRPHYQEFAKHCYEAGVTPLFEYCSRNNTVVIDHPVERLVLLAMRDNNTGLYANHATVKVNALCYGIDIAELRHIESFDTVPGLEGEEGIVVQFDNGHCLKVKTDWYLRIHKAKDGLHQEKNVIEMIVADKCDDVLPFLLDDNKKRLEQFRDVVIDGMKSTYEIIEKNIDKIKKTNMTRKDFALSSGPVPMIRGIIFKHWDKLDAITFDTLRQSVLDHIGTQSKVDATRHVWGFHKWNLHKEIE